MYLSFDLWLYPHSGRKSGLMRAKSLSFLQRMTSPLVLLPVSRDAFDKYSRISSLHLPFTQLCFHLHFLYQGLWLSIEFFLLLRNGLSLWEATLGLSYSSVSFWWYRWCSFLSLIGHALSQRLALCDCLVWSSRRSISMSLNTACNKDRSSTSSPWIDLSYHLTVFWCGRALKPWSFQRHWSSKLRGRFQRSEWKYRIYHRHRIRDRKLCTGFSNNSWGSGPFQPRQLPRRCYRVRMVKLSAPPIWIGLTLLFASSRQAG